MLDRPTSKAGWLARAAALKPEGRAFIDGAYVGALSGKTFAKTSPIDGKAFAEVADCEAADVDRAVASARRAFEKGAWRDASPTRKKAVLLRFAELIRSHTDEIALLETLDVGKPIANSLARRRALLRRLHPVLRRARRQALRRGRPDRRERRRAGAPEPLGVVGAIVPWNYPLIIAAWKIGPALVAGNSVVLKPAEQSPLGAIFLASWPSRRACRTASSTSCRASAKARASRWPCTRDVDMITFTGSTEVGKLMLRYAGQSNMKRVSLECGGKSPHVVMADADLKAAAVGDRLGHLLQPGRDLPRRLARARARLGPRRAGRSDRATSPRANPARPSLRGGLADGRARREAAHAARALLHRLRRRGGRARGVRRAARTLPETGGFYVEPTILDDARNDMRIAQEEIFGPVVVVIPFEDEAEAMRLANDTIYGLAAAVWTADMNVAHRLSRAMRAGHGVGQHLRPLLA